MKSREIAGRLCCQNVDFVENGYCATHKWPPPACLGLQMAPTRPWATVVPVAAHPEPHLVVSYPCVFLFQRSNGCGRSHLTAPPGTHRPRRGLGMPTEPTPRPHNAEKPVLIGLDHPQRDRCPERPPPSGFATPKIEIREPARRALVAAGCRSSAASAGHTARRARRAGLDRPVAAHGQVERRQRSQDLPLGGVWVVYFGERPRKRAPRADWARFGARRRWGAPRVVGGWWGAAGRAPRAPGRAPARVFVLSLHAECGPNRCCR